MQTVNKIKLEERKIPSDDQLLARTRERLQVKVEHEMRAIPPPQMAFLVDRLIPVIEAMTESHEGRRDLAAVCAAYLEEHRPETSVSSTDVEGEAPAADAPGKADAASRRPRRGGERKGGQRRRRR
jgi:hypothetical protein